MNNAWIVIFIALLTGCSALNTSNWHPTTDELIEQKQFVRALEITEKHSPVDKKLIDKIERLAAKHRRAELKHIQTLLINKQWLAAEHRLEELETHVPAHKKIASTYKQLNDLRENERLKLEAEKLLAKSLLLKIELKEVEFNDRNRDPSFSWYSNKAKLNDERIELAQNLIELTQESFDHNNLYLAKQSLFEALLLDSTLEVSKLKKELEAEINRRNKASLAEKQSQLIKQLNSAIEGENFEQIVRLVKTLSSSVYKGKQVKQKLDEANILLSSNAKELDETADFAYRQGHVRQAIELWQQSQTLYAQLPGVEEKLSRAQKVLNKLEDLRQSQIH